MARPIDIHLPGGVILLTPPGLLPARLVHSHALCNVSALQRLRRDRTALAELRREWPMLGLPQDPRHTPTLGLVGAVEDAVRRRRMDLHWLPHDTGREVTERARVRGQLPGTVGEWHWHEKIATALQRALTSEALGKELRRVVEQLLDPQNLLLAIPLIAAMAIPGGSAVMAAFAYAVAGWSGLMAMIDFGRATIKCVQATTQAELNEAAEHYARAIVALGAALLSRFIARLGVRGRTSMGRPAPRRAAPARRAPPPPPPRHTAKVGATTVAAKPVGQTVYRSDGRSPGEIFDQGFQPRGKKTDLVDFVENDVKDSAFVSTSKTQDIYKSDFYGGDQRYLYQVDGRQVHGIDVNTVHKTNSFAGEQEIAVMGGVPREAIVSARKVLPDRTLGPVIPNPGYKGGP